MNNVITIGCRKTITLASILHDAGLLLQAFEIPFSDGDLGAVAISPNARNPYSGPIALSGSYYGLQNRQSDLRISIGCSETEPPIPDFPREIRDPYTISLSLWVGANAITR